MKTRSQTSNLMKTKNQTSNLETENKLLSKIVSLQTENIETLTKLIAYKKFALLIFKNTSNCCPTGMNTEQSKREFIKHIENETLNLDVLGAILGGFPFESFDKTPEYFK